MKLVFTYSEIEEKIESQAGQSLRFQQVDEHTVRLTMTVSVMMFKKDISTEINIAQVLGTDVYMSYTGLMDIHTLLSALKSKVPAGVDIDDIITPIGSNMAIIHLGNIAQMRPIFNAVTLTDITFDYGGIAVGFSVRLPQLNS